MDTRMQPSKRAYEKPKLRTIDLAAEEVLATGCKLTTGGAAPLSVINCVNNNCASEGS